MATSEQIYQKYSPIQEMADDLKRFVTSGSEEYVLESSVHIEWDSREYDIKYLTQDIDYNDIFMTEKEWDEDTDQDIIDFTNLEEKYAKKVFESVLSQEIDNGWQWQNEAVDFLLQKFPRKRWSEEELRKTIFDFVESNWQKLATNAQNYENFLHFI